MVEVHEWTGLEIAEGRYSVLERIGVGSMGQVYRARDCHLETEVVIKCPVPMNAEMLGPEFIKRFDLEVRSLVDLTHPHIVKIIDVGTHDGFPYVVMQYLSGGTLKDRVLAGPKREPVPQPPGSLWDWLMEVAKALDFIHGQGYLHRDVKPDNILFDRYGNAFLSDFGIIKMLAREGEPWQANTMTAPGYLMGTPNYVAPEIVMGATADGRVDQYSLAMTVHEAPAGWNFVQGTTPSATMVNQTKVTPPPLIGLIPGIAPRLSNAVLRGLSKDPKSRFENCVAFACEVLAEVPSNRSSPLIAKGVEPLLVRGESGRMTCPVCQNALPSLEEHVGERVFCARCEATLLVEPSNSPTVVLEVISPPAPSWTARSHDAAPGANRQGDLVRWPAAGAGSGPIRAYSIPGPPGVRHAATPGWKRWLTYGTAALALVTCGLFLRHAFTSGEPPEGRRVVHKPAAGETPDERSAGAAVVAVGAVLPAPVEPVVLNIAYGTEKKKWMQAALDEFLKTPAGANLQINLHGMGSVEGAMAVLDGPKPAQAPHQPIHVWSPASSAYRDVLESEWKIKHGVSPILRAENLALTPMVFVTWKERHDALLKKFSKIDFRTVAEAMKEADGWGGIAQKPEWGLFKFGHTDPNKSNSGLQTLVLMAYEFSGKLRGLNVKDIAEDRFQTWLREFERGVTRHGSSLTHSTGTLMEEMVLRGPSQYDCLMLYENLAIDYMRIATERWGEQGEFSVVYPDPNIWNEHPYYILDVPWSDERQRNAASRFLSYLMSEPVQRRALEHGFRPGNSAIPVNTPSSPLVVNAKYGLKINLPQMCEPPSAEVVTTLLGSFRRLER